jgi:K+-sensing histidine kinase KdpD
MRLQVYSARGVLPMICVHSMASGPVLALVDRAADDADVVAEAVWLARATRASVLLVHVARPVMGGQPAFELRVTRELEQLAEQARDAGVTAHVDDVYFGDTSAEVAYAAACRRASAVVAARRPSRFSRLLAWRSRDVQLGRLLSVPLVLVEPSAASPSAVDLEVQASRRPVEPKAVETTRDPGQRAA